MTTPRRPWELDAARFTFAGKRVLVTGAAGTVGQELVRQLLTEHDPALVRLFDHNESGLFFADQALRALGPERHGRTRPLMGDVRDRERLLRALQNIDAVLHCASLKSTRLCDYNPFETVQTNLIGVENLIAAAVECGVQRVVALSSTHAVNPTGVMGASQLMAERLLGAAQQASGVASVVFASVRFGEVLCPGADLVLSLRDQLQAGGTVTLPAAEATRFVLPLGDAARLVLAAATQAVGGEVFVVKMPSVRLAELAQQIGARVAQGTAVRIEVSRTDPLLCDRVCDELVSESELPQCVDAGDFVVMLPTWREPAPGLPRVLHAPRSDQAVPMSPGGIDALLRESGALS